jgi:hypothetical protein
MSAAFGSFEASHVATCPDIAPECATTVIPDHMHHVRLNLSHYELAASYGLRARVQLFLRVPYDVKDQRVRYSTLEGAPFTPPYGDIHHRSETLTGITDPSVGLEWSPSPHWLFGAGTTIPAGHTVANPIVLGREGKTHEHIQFGSGTFRPLLSAQWSPPHFSASAEAALSFYENDRGFRAPTTITWATGPSFRAGRVGIDPRLTGQLQTIGRWNGEVDEGTGFHNGGLRLQFSVPVRTWILAPSVYRELWSHATSGEESFQQGTTWGVSIIRSY